MDAPTGPLAVPRMAPATRADGARHGDLDRAATALEAAFLAEMLGHAGLGRARESFGGGVGEGSFAAMLAREYAAQIAESGRTGIAQDIHRALRRGAGA